MANEPNKGQTGHAPPAPPAPEVEPPAAKRPDARPRARYVTRGAIRHEKTTIPAGKPIKPEDLPEGDFDRMVGEGVIVLEAQR